MSHVDPITVEIVGSGTGSVDSTEWRVIKVSDGELMDYGSGDVADFAFIGEYYTDYQLQFR